MSTISACLVVHHEAARLAACLESFANEVDEIVVVHDGPCADATLSIARRFTDKIFATGARSGDGEFIRPFALEQCTQDWVLVIDADERLSIELRAALRALTDTAEYDAYGFAWPYVDESGAHLASSSMSGKKFLFRRARMYTIGLPHMTPETYGPSTGLALEVHHLLDPAAGAFAGLLAKNRRRGRAAAAKLATGIDRIELYNANLLDDRVKNLRKIRLLARRPLLALLVIPAWGFCYWYFGQGYFKAGRIGLRDALNLPLYYAAFALNMIGHRRKPNPAGGHRKGSNLGSE
jgi:glycosyltransferase involved in cell wall biosynthesis